MGRINIVKMDSLPKLLCIFQAIPLIPSVNLMAQLRKAIGSFIWAYKASRIRRETLIRTKKMEVSDFTIYLQAASIIRIMDWFHNSKYKQWVTLEEDITPLKLRSLPWIKPQYRPGKKRADAFCVINPEDLGFNVKKKPFYIDWANDSFVL